MGASGWSYFTPYDEDVDRALQQLRTDVLKTGRFLREFEVAKQLPLGWFARTMIFIANLFYAGKRRSLRKMNNADAALEASGESGTHSIIDIVGISRIREPGYVTKAPARVLEKIYGTDQPTRDDIAAHEGDLDEELDRWEAYYVVVYRNGQPDELYFEGNSGD